MDSIVADSSSRPALLGLGDLDRRAGPLLSAIAAVSASWARRSSASAPGSLLWVSWRAR